MVCANSTQRPLITVNAPSALLVRKTCCFVKLSNPTSARVTLQHKLHELLDKFCFCARGDFGLFPIVLL